MFNIHYLMRSCIWGHFWWTSAALQTHWNSLVSHDKTFNFYPQHCLNQAKLIYLKAHVLQISMWLFKVTLFYSKLFPTPFHTLLCGNSMLPCIAFSSRPALPPTWVELKLGSQRSCILPMGVWEEKQSDLSTALGATESRGSHNVHKPDGVDCCTA